MKFKHILAISAATFLACQWTLPAVAHVAPQEAIEGESDAPRSVFTQKYCSYFVAGNWRDVVLVPDTWNARNCERLGKAMGRINSWSPAWGISALSLSAGRSQAIPA
jgi:hypothetical protein